MYFQNVKLFLEHVILDLDLCKRVAARCQRTQDALQSQGFRMSQTTSVDGLYITIRSQPGINLHS